MVPPILRVRAYSSHRFISVPLARNGLKVVDKCSILTFVAIKAYAGSFAELVDRVKKIDHVHHRVGDESSIIRVKLASKL